MDPIKRHQMVVDKMHKLLREYGLHRTMEALADCLMIKAEVPIIGFVPENKIPRQKKTKTKR